MMIMMMMMYRSQVNQMMTDQNCCVRAVTQQFTPSLCTGNIIYHYTCTCIEENQN